MRMALTVSSDLTVSVAADQNVNKLMDKQEILKKSIQKGEPKSIGVSHCVKQSPDVQYSLLYRIQSC